MAAAAPNPNSNFLLLAVIGIGAYYLMSRRAVAGTGNGYYVTPSGAQVAQAQENVARYNLIGTGVKSLTGLLGGLVGSSGGNSNPILWDGLTNDGWAANPAGGLSAFDWWTTNGTAGD